MSTKTSRRGPQTPGGKSAGKSAGKQTKGGKKGRKPIAPVRVGKDRNWGPIALFVAVGVVAAGIVGWAAFALLQQDTRPWVERAESIDGVVNWYEEHPDLIDTRHVSGPVQYEINPPAGGPHSELYQTCNGVVYEDTIPTEHALHSMEHGAVWVTYRPDLAESEVNQLARRVENTNHLMMSPFEGQQAPISLQAWGFQLQVDNASDERIDEFIRALRIHAGLHDGGCSGGVAVTGQFPVG